MRQLKLPGAATPSASRGPRAGGFTLVELMVGLAIAAILAVAAAPAFGEYIANARLRENGNALYLQTMLAQSEAIKRNTVVRVAVDDSEIVVTDRNDPDAPVVLKTVALTHGIGIDGAGVAVDFGGEGRPLGFAAASVDLIHPSLSCSADIRCPGLRVDGGGGVRLCNDHTADGCS
jgi:type IV fimbrial biogenesis protein FimT